MIERFAGEYRFLSNFWPCHVAAIWYGVAGQGIMVNSVEHAYQAMKAERLQDFSKICTAPNPGLAKKWGRTIPRRPNWEDQKVPIMAGLVLQKFSLDAELKEKLLATGEQTLIEGNYWGDHFWGVCDGRGENHLGKILMQVREQLR